MARLNEKIAIVTGGGNGIGRAVCRRFVREGAKVTVADINVENGTSVANELGDDGHFFQLDVRNEDDWQSIINNVIKRHGRLDILVNNAGILATTKHQSIDDVEVEEWRTVQGVNVEGVFLGCRAAVKVMKQQKTGGAIVNLSSIAGLIASPKLVAYGASKGAVRQMTKSIAIDCANKRYRIRCNSVHPGFVMTDMGKGAAYMGDGDPKEQLKARINATPMGVEGLPDDIANGILFLASDEARYVTGAELVIDGGMTAV